MSKFGGILKVVGGLASYTGGGICSDGPIQVCPKCGMPHHGVCGHCATERGSELIREGFNDIKEADRAIYIEAEKKGYIKAGNEYGAVFEKIKNDYKAAKREYEKILREKDMYSEELIVKHEHLVAERKRLELEYNSKVERMSKDTGVSAGMIKGAITGKAFASIGESNLIEILYKYKEKKIREAECKGYNRAKQEYEKKIQVLQNELNTLQVMNNRKIKELQDMISDVLAAISEERMKIATMRIIE